MSSADRFRGAELKLERADQHILELGEILDDYGRRLTISYEPVVGAEELSELRVSEPLPGMVSVVLGDAIHNMRSALDLAMCSIARERGVDTKHMKFPFADSEAKFEALLKEKYLAPIGLDVQDFLRAIHPYPLGNPELHALHSLDILDKHRLCIPVLAVTWGKSSFDFTIEALKGNGFDTSGVFSVGDGSDVSLDFVGSRMSTEDARRSYPTPYQPGRPATALFPSDCSIPNRHVVDTCIDLLQRTWGVLLSFESLKVGP
jgi:hypothetical protein